MTAAQFLSDDGLLLFCQIKIDLDGYDPVFVEKDPCPIGLVSLVAIRLARAEAFCWHLLDVATAVGEEEEALIQDFLIDFFIAGW